MKKKISRLVNRLFSKSKTTLAFILASAWGVILIFWQLLQDRGLWADEVVYSLNILNKSFVEFLSPLDYYVAAPLGFMTFEKVLVNIFGINDLSYRIFPLICMLSSLLLLKKVFETLFKNSLIVWASISLFVLSPAIIYYATEIKPYATDCFLTSLILFLTVCHERKTYLLAIVGFLSIFFSNGIILFLFSLGLYYCMDHIKMKKIPPIKLSVLLILWLVGVVIFYIFFVKVHDQANAWHQDWLDVQGGFLISKYYHYNPFRMILGIWEIFASNKGFIYDNSYPYLRSFIVDGNNEINSYKDILNILPIGKIWVFFIYLTGLYNIFKRKNLKLFCLICLPLIVHTLLMFAEIYPIGIRIMVYQMPIIILTIGFGIKFLAEESMKYNKAFIMTHVILTLVLCINISNTYPYDGDPTKKALNHLISEEKKNPALEITMVSYSTMIDHYTAQKKYTHILKNIKLHPIRIYPIPLDINSSIHWIYIAPQQKQKALDDIKKRYEIVERIDSINLYRVEHQTKK